MSGRVPTAELDADFDRPLRMSRLPIRQLAQGDVTLASDVGFVLASGPVELDVVGEDLVYDDDGGAPSAGTVTDVDVYWNEETWFTIAGARADIEDLGNAVDDRDALAFFEAFLGDDDEILGSTGNDELFGFAGDDVIRGGQGNDVLRGGPGDDVVLGGEGERPARRRSGERRATRRSGARFAHRRGGCGQVRGRRRAA